MRSFLNTDKKLRSLEEILHDFQGKVIKAAQKLQLELSDSAERPAASSVEQSAPMDTADGVDLDEHPVLAELGARQRKRAQASTAEERRPAAKVKASVRPGKRTQSVLSGSAEQPASTKKERRLTAEDFAACAVAPAELEQCEPASSSSSAQPGRQRRRWMYQLYKELTKLDGWLVGDAADEAKGLKEYARTLSQKNIPRECFSVRV